MKTYFSFSVLFVLIFFGCSKSDGNSDANEQDELVKVDYIVLLSKDDLLTPQFLSSDDEVITINAEKSALPENLIPDLSLFDGFDFIQYHKNGNCNGKITSHNFDTNVTIESDVFSDFKDCNLIVSALGKSNNSLFISYELPSTMLSTYYVRIIDLSDSSNSHIDISLDEKPVDLAIANNRLFILTLDADKNSLLVFDIPTKALIHEKGLGGGVDRMFTDTQDNIIISYNEFHTVVNSAALSFEYTQYENSVIAPKFSTSVSANFDNEGKLYYPRQPGETSSYDLVPAIYDFDKKLVVMYAYENFLSEAKRKFEYEIETTTVVGYDEKNGLMLVGYKKVNTAAKSGGILRIKLSPEPILMDNIDLDGVPYEILIN